MSLAERNFDSLADLILAPFDTPALAHQWSSLAQVCRRWAAAVSRFDITALTPRQLYYDAAAISLHDIPPPAHVWFMLPQNTIVPPQRERSSISNLNLRDLPPPLGWPSGTDAAEALLRKWGAPAGWDSILKLWLINGDVDTIRIAQHHRNDQPPDWSLCIKPAQHIGIQRTYSLLTWTRYDAWAYLRFTVAAGHRLEHMNEFPCQFHLLSIMRIHNAQMILNPQQLSEVVGALDQNSFNLALAELVTADRTDLLPIFAESNHARPRYEPLYLTPTREQVGMFDVLATMCAGPEYYSTEPHPYPLHVPTMCRICYLVAIPPHEKRKCAECRS